jgi:hypothetical protein
LISTTAYLLCKKRFYMKGQQSREPRNLQLLSWVLSRQIYMHAVSGSYQWEQLGNRLRACSCVTMACAGDRLLHDMAEEYPVHTPSKITKQKSFTFPCIHFIPLLPRIYHRTRHVGLKLSASAGCEGVRGGPIHKRAMCQCTSPHT